VRDAGRRGEFARVDLPRQVEILLRPLSLVWRPQSMRFDRYPSVLMKSVMIPDKPLCSWLM
jgi:hypothetical protein